MTRKIPYIMISSLLLVGSLQANWLTKQLDKVADNLPGSSSSSKSSSSNSNESSNSAKSVSSSSFVAKPAPSYMTKEPSEMVTEASSIDVGINIFSFAQHTVLTASEEAQMAQSQSTSGQERVVYVDKAPRAIREVESYSLPVMLKDELLATSQFKSVSLRPGPTDVHDIIVDGEIRKSTGNSLVLRLSAIDATGTKWLNYDYDVNPTQDDFLDSPPDPYAPALQSFVNTLLNVVNQKGDQVAKLERLANVKYAASLSPEVFGEYLEKDAYGRTRLVGMPSADDAFWAYAMRCHEEESHILANDFGQFYRESQSSVYQSYFAWRREYGSSLEAYERLKREHEKALADAKKRAQGNKVRDVLTGIGGGLLRGGQDPEDVAKAVLLNELAETVENSLRVDSEGNLYFSIDEGLRDEYPELEASYNAAREKEEKANQQHAYMMEQSLAFQNHAEPINVELFDATVELEGSVDKQFETLRKRLVEVYERETGKTATASL